MYKRREIQGEVDSAVALTRLMFGFKRLLHYVLKQRTVCLTSNCVYSLFLLPQSMLSPPLLPQPIALLTFIKVILQLQLQLWIALFPIFPNSNPCNRESDWSSSTFIYQPTSCAGCWPGYGISLVWGSAHLLSNQTVSGHRGEQLPGLHRPVISPKAVCRAGSI